MVLTVYQHTVQQGKKRTEVYTFVKAAKYTTLKCIGAHVKIIKHSNGIHVIVHKISLSLSLATNYKHIMIVTTSNVFYWPKMYTTHCLNDNFLAPISTETDNESTKPLVARLRANC